MQSRLAHSLVQTQPENMLCITVEPTRIKKGHGTKYKGRE